MGAETQPSRRTVLLHGGVYTASRFLNQGVTFLLLPLYAHLLGSQGVGVVEVMNVLRSFLFVLFAQGLDATWFRFRFAKGKAELRRFESTIIWYLLFASFIGVTALWLSGDRLGRVLTPGVPFFPLGVFSAVTASALIFSSLVERRLQAEQRPVAFAVFSLARTAGTLLAILWFVALWRRGAAGKVEAEALAAVVAAVVSIAILSPGLRFDSRELRAGLRYGWPLVPHAMAAFLNDLLDRFVVNAMLGLEAVGVYSMGYRVAGVGMMVMVALNQAFSPIFIQSVERAEREDSEGRRESGDMIRRHIASLGFFNVLFACAVAMGISTVAREVLVLATTSEFRDSWRVVAPVSAGVVAWGWYCTLSQSVTYRTATVHRLPLITISAALANLTANFVLVPVFGIAGAAWATLLSNVVMAGGTLYVGMRSLPIPYAFGRWAAASLWTAVSLFVIWHIDARVGDFGTRVGVKAAWLLTSLGILLPLSGVRPGSVKDLFFSPARAASRDRLG